MIPPSAEIHLTIDLYRDTQMHSERHTQMPGQKAAPLQAQEHTQMHTSRFEHTH